MEKICLFAHAHFAGTSLNSLSYCLHHKIKKIESPPPSHLAGPTDMRVTKFVVTRQIFCSVSAVQQRIHQRICPLCYRRKAALHFEAVGPSAEVMWLKLVTESSVVWRNRERPL